MVRRERGEQHSCVMWYRSRHRSGKVNWLNSETLHLKLKQPKYDDRLIPYYSLYPSPAGGAIVIASSNNGAVENISLELPGMERQYRRDVSDRSDYFGGLATVILTDLHGTSGKDWAIKVTESSSLTHCGGEICRK